MKPRAKRKPTPPPVCPYCGTLARLVDSKVIYRTRSYGMVWDCRPCDAYVGVHAGTDVPLGRMANRELREWKVRAHAVFDPLWKCGAMPRRAAYALLASRLSVPHAAAHIGMLDVPQCKAVVEAFRE